MADTPEAQAARGAWLGTPWPALDAIKLGPVKTRTAAERKAASREGDFDRYLVERFRRSS